MSEGSLVAELASRLVGIAIVSSDIGDDDIRDQNIESLTAHIRNHFGTEESPALLNRELLVKIKEEMQEFAPKAKVEIIRNSSFSPLAKEVKEDFAIKNAVAGKTAGAVPDFTAYFNDRLNRIKEIIYNGQANKAAGMIHDIESLKQYTSGREVVIAGMVYDKIITKNGHVLVTIDDETGTQKILFMKPFSEGANGAINELFAKALKIINDEVIAVRGKMSGPFVMANALIYPDVPVHQMKKTEEDIAIAFTSDVHVGSKLFEEKQFNRFVDWLNGKYEHRKELAERIKYIVVSGDLVDGIGVYPNQERELAIDDIYKQYSEFFTLFSKIPEYVHVFILTGNHDAVQRAEPQPKLPNEFYKDFKLSNMHLVSNPGYITLNGIRVLGYHGTSLDSIIQGIPGCSYSKPEGAMLEILKRRHLSPIYGDNPIVPLKSDSMVMDKVPDILHMGHLHKNGYAEYHGTLIVNSGTWQARTGFQVRMGHVPTPSILPVYEAKQGVMTTVDFNRAFS